MKALAAPSRPREAARLDQADGAKAPTQARRLQRPEAKGPRKRADQWVAQPYLAKAKTKPKDPKTRSQRLPLAAKTMPAAKTAPMPNQANIAVKNFMPADATRSFRGIKSSLGALRAFALHQEKPEQAAHCKSMAGQGGSPSRLTRCGARPALAAPQTRGGRGALWRCAGVFPIRG